MRNGINLALERLNAGLSHPCHVLCPLSPLRAERRCEVIV
jgi:hypothetical protein